MISERVSDVIKSIYINNQVRKYYGKKYYRQASAGSSGGTQTRYSIDQARSSKGRSGKSSLRVGKGKENPVISEPDVVKFE